MRDGDGRVAGVMAGTGASARQRTTHQAHHLLAVERHSSSHASCGLLAVRHLPGPSPRAAAHLVPCALLSRTIHGMGAHRNRPCPLAETPPLRGRCEVPTSTSYARHSRPPSAWVEGWYNHRCIRRGLGWRSPVEYEEDAYHRGEDVSVPTPRSVLRSSPASRPRHRIAGTAHRLRSSADRGHGGVAKASGRTVRP